VQRAGGGGGGAGGSDGTRTEGGRGGRWEEPRESRLRECLRLRPSKVEVPVEWLGGARESERGRARERERGREGESGYGAEAIYGEMSEMGWW